MKKTILLVLILILGMAIEFTKADYIFGEPTNLGKNINSTYNDGTPCLTRDGLTLYFSSTRPPGGGGNHDLWVATRASITDVWSEPVHLGSAVNSGAQDWAPTVSADGLTLYFRSTRYGQGDIWVSTRSSKDAPWLAAVNAGPSINTNSDECMPCISADGLEFYFGSARPGGSGKDDLYVATRATTEEPWSEPVNLGPEVNSEGGDASANISPDGLTLFFNSDRNSGFGSADLYVITRASKEAPWSASVNLGTAINTEDDEMTPCLWPDGSVLYFSSWAERPGGVGGADIWEVTVDPVVDFNGDGIVDSADVCIMVDHWGENYSYCDIGPTPIGDGVVNTQDLVVISEYFFEDINDPTLAAHWALDETEGMIVSDSAGENDGYAIGGPVWQPGGGRADGALQLDGVDDYVIMGAPPNPAEGPFSLLAWIKGGAPGQVVVSQQGAANWLAADAEGNLMTELKGIERSAGSLQTQTIITDDHWHRVGFVWDGTKRILYVDDFVVAENVQVGLEASISSLYIGCGKAMEHGTFFSGFIDDVRIYNRAVTP